MQLEIGLRLTTCTVCIGSLVLNSLLLKFTSKKTPNSQLLSMRFTNNSRGLLSFVAVMNIITGSTIIVGAVTFFATAIIEETNVDITCILRHSVVTQGLILSLVFFSRLIYQQQKQVSQISILYDFSGHFYAGKQTNIIILFFITLCSAYFLTVNSVVYSYADQRDCETALSTATISRYSILVLYSTCTIFVMTLVCIVMRAALIISNVALKRGKKKKLGKIRIYGQLFNLILVTLSVLPYMLIQLTSIIKDISIPGTELIPSIYLMTFPVIYWFNDGHFKLFLTKGKKNNIGTMHGTDVNAVRALRTKQRWRKLCKQALTINVSATASSPKTAERFNPLDKAISNDEVHTKTSYCNSEKVGSHRLVMLKEMQSDKENTSINTEDCKITHIKTVSDPATLIGLSCSAMILPYMTAIETVLEGDRKNKGKRATKYTPPFFQKIGKSFKS